MHVCLIPFLHQGNKGAVRRAAGHVPSMSLTACTYLCSSAFDRGSWSKCSSAASTLVVLLLLSSPGLPLAEAALMWSWVSDQGRDIWRGSFPPHARSQGRPLTSGVNLFLLSWSNEKSMQELYVKAPDNWQTNRDKIYPERTGRQILSIWWVNHFPPRNFSLPIPFSPAAIYVPYCSSI
jgi:hypothetical protein